VISFLKLSLSKFLKRPHCVILLITYFAYCAFICFMEIKHHVFWRDEVRAFSIAKQAESLPNLLSLLRNEGHPPLWYLILKSLYLIFHQNWVLPLASILIAMVSAFLWLFFAPFSVLERVLFLAGVFPLFEFSVMARNYGISMLLMFLFCTQFKERLTHPYRAYLPLFFLPTTNAHSAILTGIVVAGLFAELLLKKGRRVSDFIAPGLVLGSVGWVIWTLHTNTTSSVVYSPGVLNLDSVTHAVIQFLQSPGHALIATFGHLDATYNWLFRSLIMLAFGLVLIRRPALLLIYLVTACAFSCFSDLIYPLQFRHQGVFYIFWLSCVWVDHSLPAAKTAWSRHAVPAIVVLLLVWQSSIAFSTVTNQFEIEQSSANLVADLVHSHPELKDAVLIGEPDFIMDTIPYYLDNRIYFPRGGRYGSWILFTREWRSAMTLEELSDTARLIHAQTNQPVVFLIGTQIRWSLGSGSASRFSYNQSLTWTVAGLDRFSHEVKLIGSFLTPTSGDESYDVYEWIGAKP
jgi:hypothetical protein